MYELIQVGDQSYYINCPAKIGVYDAGEGKVYLIDSGNDKEAGKKARKILETKGWSLQGILNTHSNADHIGGNQYLQGQTGCKVFAGGIEAAFTRYPLLEPSFLYGGYPGKDLRHKFLMAKECRVSDFSDPDFPKEIEIIPLPGHFFDMVGFRTPDDTVFLADCVSSKETLEKYAIPFIYDVDAYLNTLEQVREMKGRIFVPSHAEPGSDLGALLDYNRKQVLAIGEVLLEICKEPMHFEQVLQKVFFHYGLVMSFEQYVLVGSTVRSYLFWLKDQGKLTAAFQDNLLLWKAI